MGLIEALLAHMDLIASAFGISSIWFMGKRKWWAPWLGLLGQGPWIALALVNGLYGLLPASAVYGLNYAIAGVRWYRDLKVKPWIVQRLWASLGRCTLCGRKETFSARALPLRVMVCPCCSLASLACDHILKLRPA
jgi:hypothetical protein